MTLPLSKNTLAKNSLFIILALLLSIPSAFAIDLKSAKSQGLVGERNDGYLGFVTQSPSADIKSMVKDVNRRRKAKFEKTAKKSNISTRQVANRFYERAVQATASGHYYQSSSGSWVKK